MILSKSVLPIVLLASYIQADFYNTMSLQGTTGVINTPTAEVINSGDMEIQYSNQVDFGGHNDRYNANQYFINFGFLPNIELIGRLANLSYKNPPTAEKKRHNWYIRDLSASFKYQIPYYNEYLPHIAIGVNDLGGQASHYDAKYIVATKEYNFLRGSVGYGFDSINLLDGAFGSLELKATNWATLLAEYDSKDTQVGLRLNTPSTFSNYFDMSFLAKANLSDDGQKYSFGLSLKTKIGNDHENKDPLDDNFITELNKPTKSDPMEVLAQSLVDFGFENVDVGTLNNSLYVAYENNILEHNELDALGVILTLMSKSKTSFDNFTIVIKKSEQSVKKLKGSLIAYKEFLKNPTKQNIKNFKDTLILDQVDNSGVDLSYKAENSSRFKTRLTLSPELISFVGTEVGVLDYELLAGIYTSMHIYKGFDLGVKGVVPISNSDDLDSGGAFAKSYKKAKIDSALLHRTDIYGDFINIASIGVKGDFWAMMDSFTYAHDNHTFSLKLDYLEKRDQEWWEDRKEIRTNYLGIYSYYMPQLDTNFRITAGEYYYGDHGFELRMKKFFGDTAISFFYQNSDQNYIGINVALPLTPRRVADSYLQLKGKKDFNYGLRTTVQDEDGRNTIETSYLVRIYNDYDIEQSILNRNRLSIEYIKAHLLRLRDAGMEYIVTK